MVAALDDFDTDGRSPIRRYLSGIVVTLVSVLAVAGCTSGEPGVLAPASGRPVGSSPPPTSPDAVRLTAQRLPVQLPVPISDAVVYADGSKLVVAGGLTAQDTSTASVVLVDLLSHRVSRAGRLLAAVHDAAGVVLGGRRLLFGGGTTTSVATVQLVGVGQPSQLAGTMPEPRSDLVAAVSGGFGYVLAGYTGTRMLATVLQTSDGRSFRPVASLPVPVRYPAVAVSGNQLWLCGGVTGAGTATDVVQRVDLVSGTARVVGHLPQALSHAAGFTLRGSVYLAGGQRGGGRSAAILRIDADGTTSQVGTLPMPLSDAAVAVVGDVSYLVGGQTPAATANIVQIGLTASVARS